MKRRLRTDVKRSQRTEAIRRSQEAGIHRPEASLSHTHFDQDTKSNAQISKHSLLKQTPPG